MWPLSGLLNIGSCAMNSNFFLVKRVLHFLLYKSFQSCLQSGFSLKCVCVRIMYELQLCICLFSQWFIIQWRKPAQTVPGADLRLRAFCSKAQGESALATTQLEMETFWSQAQYTNPLRYICLKASSMVSRGFLGLNSIFKFLNEIYHCLWSILEQNFQFSQVTWIL